MNRMLIAATVASLATIQTAAAEPLPSTAKKATMEEFKALADKKTVDVVIYDLGVPVTATLVWDWKKKTITGNALANKKKIKVKTKLSFDGDKACSTGDDKKTNCHAIHIDGTKFYEVRDDGQVHAMSTVK